MLLGIWATRPERNRPLGALVNKLLISQRSNDCFQRRLTANFAHP